MYGLLYYEVSWIQFCVSATFLTSLYTNEIFAEMFQDDLTVKVGETLKNYPFHVALDQLFSRQSLLCVFWWSEGICV